MARLTGHPWDSVPMASVGEAARIRILRLVLPAFSSEEHDAGALIELLLRELATVVPSHGPFPFVP